MRFRGRGKSWSLGRVGYLAIAFMEVSANQWWQLPAMEYLLQPSELGPVRLSMTKLIVWSLGLCYFGVMFAVPL